MPTIYTFATKGGPVIYFEGASASHYMNQPNDGARVAIQGIGNGPMTMGATTATVVGSPVGIPSSGALTLPTPESAIEVTLITPSIASGIKVSEVSASLTTYVVVPPSTVFPAIDIANCAYLYLQSAAGTTATLSFYYTLV